MNHQGSWSFAVVAELIQPGEPVGDPSLSPLLVPSCLRNTVLAFESDEDSVLVNIHPFGAIKSSPVSWEK